MKPGNQNSFNSIKSININGSNYKYYSISEAETLAEKEVSSIKGPLFHRTDIGTDEIIQKRIDHINSLR